MSDPVYLRFVLVPPDQVRTAGEIAIHVGHDVDGLFAAYQALGVTIIHPPTSLPRGLREFRIKDLNGHVFRFSSYL